MAHPERVEKILWLVGILLLGCYVVIHLEASFYQSYAQWSFQQQLEGHEETSVNEPQRVEPEPFHRQPSPGDVLGRLEIERLGLSVMVQEGVDRQVLRRGVGHIPKTPYPGEGGNVGVAGHRDTFFRLLKDIEQGDQIQLATLQGVYHYEVEWTSIVPPTRVDVIEATDEETLTLVTCYPFYYVGSAPKRFIVRARQIKLHESGHQAIDQTTQAGAGQ